MVPCPKCGSENLEDAIYCANCGAPLTQHMLLQKRIDETDYLGMVSTGIVLILLAITYFRYPIDFYLIIDYVQRITSSQSYIKPPQTFFPPAIFFFNIIGIWSLTLTVLRLISQRSVHKSIGDFAGAVFSFFIAFLLTNYANNTISGRTILAYLIVGVGLLIIINILITFAFRGKLKRLLNPNS